MNDGSHHGIACDVSVGLDLLIMIEVLRNSTSEARARSRDGQYLAVNVPIGTKQTYAVTAPMSAFDPKQTSRFVAGVLKATACRPLTPVY